MKDAGRVPAGSRRTGSQRARYHCDRCGAESLQARAGGDAIACPECGAFPCWREPFPRALLVRRLDELIGKLEAELGLPAGAELPPLDEEEDGAAR